MDNIVTLPARRPTAMTRQPKVRLLGCFFSGRIMTCHREEMEPASDFPDDSVVRYHFIAVRDRCMVAMGPGVLPPHGLTQAND